MILIFNYFKLKMITGHILLIINNFYQIKTYENTKISVFKVKNFQNFERHYLSCTKTELRGSKKKRQSSSKKYCSLQKWSKVSEK